MKTYMNIKLRISDECGKDRFTEEEVLQLIFENKIRFFINDQKVKFLLRIPDGKVIGVVE